MERVGLFGVEPARVLALIIGTLVLIKKIVAPHWLTEENIAAINDWLLLALPFIAAEATRLFVVPTAKVNAVTDTATQARIEAVTSQTPKG